MYLISFACAPHPLLCSHQFCGTVSWEPHKISLKTTRSAETNLWAPFILITTLWERLFNAICVIVCWTDCWVQGSLLPLFMRSASSCFGFFSAMRGTLSCSHHANTNHFDVSLSVRMHGTFSWNWIVCKMSRGNMVLCDYFITEIRTTCMPEGMQTMGHQHWNLGFILPKKTGYSFTDWSGLNIWN